MFASGSSTVSSHKVSIAGTVISTSPPSRRTSERLLRNYHFTVTVCGCIVSLETFRRMLFTVSVFKSRHSRFGFGSSKKPFYSQESSAFQRPK